MYILTGGAGFIGSVTAAALEASHAKNSEIVIVDSFGKSSKWNNVVKRHVREIVPPHRAIEFMDEHRNEISAVIHFGGTADTTEKNMDALHENNVCFTKALFDWCAREDKRFIFASSAAVYGEGNQGFSDSEDLRELNKLRPLHPQAWSKHLAEKYILQAEHKPSSWLILRFFNVYGPNEYHKGRMGSVIQHAYNQANQDGCIRLFKSHLSEFKNGEQARDFIYVKDIARLILWMLKHPDISGIFNVGSGKARTFNDMAEILIKNMKKKISIEYIDIPQEIRPNYQYYTQADMSKMVNAITSSNTNPFAFTSLEDGIADYVNNYLTSEDPYL